ncbi:hypothetical Protein YC6258_00402 [Gynuella sunshinyii YC6258]|uniref:Uncharacterized protein n=1 Tax=Gynuella sunshinyii YC6258 TaxID=1445510 RepID=A0A0C5VD41_9GAMM|nr:hypothetical Protein YC6258_00402 [Gynuella sunshinyii YC6258]
MPQFESVENFDISSLQDFQKSHKLLILLIFIFMATILLIRIVRYQ